MRAPLVPGHGVDLVHDHGPGAAQHGPAPFRGHQQEQRLGGGDQDVGRVLQHGGPFGRRRVARPHRHPDQRRGQPELPGHRRDLPQRRLEVLLDVRGQRLQRRHVHDCRPRLRLARALCQPGGTSPRTPPIDPVDADQERRERLARSGRRRDQRVPARRDLLPPGRLRLGRPRREPALEPGAYGGMERVKHSLTVPRAADNLPWTDSTRPTEPCCPSEGAVPDRMSPIRGHRPATASSARI